MWAEIGMNHTPGQFHQCTLTFRDFDHHYVGVSESSTSNQEVTTLMTNRRVQ